MAEVPKKRSLLRRLIVYWIAAGWFSEWLVAWLAIKFSRPGAHIALLTFLAVVFAMVIAVVGTIPVPAAFLFLALGFWVMVKEIQTIAKDGERRDTFFVNLIEGRDATDKRLAALQGLIEGAQARDAQSKLERDVINMAVDLQRFAQDEEALAAKTPPVGGSYYERSLQALLRFIGLREKLTRILQRLAQHGLHDDELSRAAAAYVAPVAQLDDMARRLLRLAERLHEMGAA